MSDDVAELGVVPQLVSGAVLVDEPYDLVGVAHEVRGELQRDDEVDRFAVRLREIDASPTTHLMHELGWRIPLERHRDRLRLVTGFAQGGDQPAHVRFRTSCHEGSLWMAHGDPHQ